MFSSILKVPVHNVLINFKSQKCLKSVLSEFSITHNANIFWIESKGFCCLNDGLMTYCYNTNASEYVEDEYFK